MKRTTNGNLHHTKSLAQTDPTLYFDSPEGESDSSSTDWIGIGTTAANVVGGLFGNSPDKMTYNEFIRERDAKLQELLGYGAEDSMDPVRGWGVELNKGFTHSQIQRNLLKDYTSDFNKFLQVVFWPVLQRVNPIAYNRLRSQQGQPAATIPPGPIPVGQGTPTLQSSTPTNVQGVLIPLIGLMILVIALLMFQKKAT